MIYYVDKDVFAAPVDAVFHQANCFCTMGSGIAKTVREQFPEAYMADLQTTKGDMKKLGTFTFASIKSLANPKLKYIFNIYGQYDFGGDKKQTRYNALFSGMKKAVNHLNDLGLKSIGIPHKIGCVRGGGNWEEVQRLIREIQFVFTDFDFYICHLDADNS